MLNDVINTTLPLFAGPLSAGIILPKETRQHESYIECATFSNHNAKQAFFVPKSHHELPLQLGYAQLFRQFIHTKRKMIQSLFPTKKTAEQYPPIMIFGEDTPGGVYSLRIHLFRPTRLVFGRHRDGTPIALERGDYLYIGAAQGNRGASTLANRLLRHATRGDGQPPHQIRAALQTALAEAGLNGVLPRRKTAHWHIDYLLDLPSARLTGVIAMRTNQKLEKPLAEELAARPETAPVSPGLGASDHPGHSHLFYLGFGDEVTQIGSKTGRKAE